MLNPKALHCGLVLARWEVQNSYARNLFSTLSLLKPRPRPTSAATSGPLLRAMLTQAGLYWGLGMFGLSTTVKGLGLGFGGFWTTRPVAKRGFCLQQIHPPHYFLIQTTFGGQNWFCPTPSREMQPRQCLLIASAGVPENIELGKALYFTSVVILALGFRRAARATFRIPFLRSLALP